MDILSLQIACWSFMFLNFGRGYAVILEIADSGREMQRQLWLWRLLKLAQQPLICIKHFFFFFVSNNSRKYRWEPWKSKEALWFHFVICFLYPIGTYLLPFFELRRSWFYKYYEVDEKYSILGSKHYFSHALYHHLVYAYTYPWH